MHVFKPSHDSSQSRETFENESTSFNRPKQWLPCDKTRLSDLQYHRGLAQDLSLQRGTRCYPSFFFISSLSHSHSLFIPYNSASFSLHTSPLHHNLPSLIQPSVTHSNPTLSTLKTFFVYFYAFLIEIILRKILTFEKSLHIQKLPFYIFVLSILANKKFMSFFNA